MPRGGIVGGGGGGGRGRGRDMGEVVNTLVEIPPNKALCVGLVVSACLTAATTTGMWGIRLEEHSSTYGVRTSVADVVIVLWLHAMCLAYVLPKQHGTLANLLLCSTLCLYIPKCIVFGWSFSDIDSALRGVVLIMSGTLLLAELILLRRAVGGSRKKIPSFSAIMKILKPYFTPKGVTNKLRALLTYLCIAGAKACNLVAPMLMGKIVSSLSETVPSMPYTTIVTYCCVCLGSKALKESQAVLYVKVKQAAFIEMTDTVFHHVHRLSLEWNLRKKMGNVVRAMDRGTSAADSIVSMLFITLGPTVLEAIVTFIIFYAHYGQRDMAAVCMLAFGTYFIVTFFLTMWRRKFREGMNQHDNDYHNKITESLVNFEMVKYFTAEERERSSVQASVQEYQKYGVVIQATLSCLNVLQQVCIYGCVLGVMLLAGQAVVDGHTKTGGGVFGVGDFVASVAYVTQLFTPLTFLGSVYNAVVMGFVNLQHLGDLLSEEPDVVDAPNAPALTLPYDPVSRGVEVAFHNVNFRYPAADAGVGIRNITFTVEAGKKVALVGPTGSGKTTLSRLLFRFYDASGEILVNGQNIAEVQQGSLRGAIGIVPQDTVLFNDTIRKNVMYGDPNATEEDMLQAAKDAQLDSVISRLPNGWDTMVGDRGLRLSGGEKQRVAIARCLLKDPPIIVLDEATSALDSSTEKDILEVLQCLKGRTLVVIAHRLCTVQDSDLIIVLKDGGISESGTHESLRRKGGLYDELWKIQENRPVEALEEVPADSPPTEEPGVVAGGTVN